jgi:hypothetical protein
MPSSASLKRFSRSQVAGPIVHTNLVFRNCIASCAGKPLSQVPRVDPYSVKELGSFAVLQGRPVFATTCEEHLPGATVASGFAPSLANCIPLLKPASASADTSPGPAAFDLQIKTQDFIDLHSCPADTLVRQIIQMTRESRNSNFQTGKGWAVCCARNLSLSTPLARTTIGGKWGLTKTLDENHTSVQRHRRRKKPPGRIPSSAGELGILLSETLCEGPPRTRNRWGPSEKSEKPQPCLNFASTG